VDPQRAEAGREADGESADVKAGDDPRRLRVDPLDVAGLERRNPDGVEGANDPDGMGLCELGAHSLRGRVDPGDDVGAVGARRPDGVVGDGDEATGDEVELDGGGDLVRPGVDAHDALAGGKGDPDCLAACGHAHVRGTTGAVGADADRRDDPVGGRVDPGHAGPQGIGDPDGPGRDGYSGGLPRYVDRRADPVRGRIDPRDGVLPRVGDPDGAAAGGSVFSRGDLDPGDDRVSPRI